MILHYFSIDDLTFVPGYCVAILEMICVLSSVTEAVYTGIRVGERYDFDKVMGVVSWTFLLILLLMYGMFKVLAQRVNKVVALQAQMKTMETDAAMVAQSDQNIEDTRKMRHDLKNHIAYMKSLLEQQDYQALNDYLAILAETATEPISHLDCGNQVINSIMNFEISKAVSHGITVEPSIILPPELPFQAPDLTSLFCNILDNAIEACLFYKSAQPVIKISMAIQGDYFISRVTNPIPAEVNKQQVLRLDSTKQEKGSHGYGTRIIRSIAQKYRGKVVFDISDGLFMADVMMDMKSEVKHD
jgi:sensor histidine kinase regulating citrate/malate metabolism